MRFKHILQARRDLSGGFAPVNLSCSKESVWSRVRSSFPYRAWSHSLLTRRRACAAVAVVCFCVRDQRFNGLDTVNAGGRFLIQSERRPFLMRRVLLALAFARQNETAIRRRGEAYHDHGAQCGEPFVAQ